MSTTHLNHQNIHLKHHILSTIFNHRLVYTLIRSLLTCHTLSAGQSYYAIETSEDRAELQKSDVSSYSVSEFLPTPTHIRLPVESHCKDVECDIAASDEVGSGNIVFVESKLGVNDDGVGDVSVLGETVAFKGSGDDNGESGEFRKEEDSGNWRVLKERDEDEGFDLFKEADGSIKEVESDDGEENWDTTEGHEPWNLAWGWDSEMEDYGVAEEKGVVNDYEDNESNAIIGDHGYEYQKEFVNGEDEDSDFKVFEKSSLNYKNVMNASNVFAVSFEKKHDKALIPFVMVLIVEDGD